jgi:2'-5' RNA ligase
MLHRVFIAINLPGDIKEKLFNFSNKYPNLPVRWVKRENIHITLSFLGNLDDNQLLDTMEIVRKVISSYNSFSVKFSKVNYGPIGKNPPRMIWAEVEENKELARLHTDLEDELFNLSSYQYKTKENRAFSAHITLGRIKSFKFRKLGQRPEIGEDINISFQVNSIDVIESNLKKTGPEYTILESISLI